MLKKLFTGKPTAQPAPGQPVPAAPAAPAPAEIFIARQPIYDTERRVAAYELLYRNSEVNRFDDSVDGTLATRRVITEALLNFGMDALTEGQKGYVNFTGELLLEGLPQLLDNQNFAIEVLESVELTPEILSAIGEIRRGGFTVVLDDYAGEPLTPEQMASFDMIKIDFLSLSRERRREVCRGLKAAGKRMLAEKIETEEDYTEARELGCTMFQGYFFARPALLRKRRQDIASSSAIRLAGALSDDNYDIRELVEIVRPDAHLAYKLLKRMNTLEYYRGWPVESIEQALTRMGGSGIRRWVALVLMELYTGDSEDEFIRTALVRGRFCELMAIAGGCRGVSGDAFLVGMFSLLDIPGEDGRSPIDDLSLSPAIMQGLRGEEGPLAELLSTAVHYERGDWEWLEGRQAGDIAPLYRQAVVYAGDTLG